jgi:type IV secretion system protein VirD4
MNTSANCSEATIDTNTYGKSQGKSGSYSTNYQQAGRELLTPDEVRLLDNNDALLFVRGERPIIDRKYNLLKHPALSLTPDGGQQLSVATELPGNYDLS